MLRYIAVFIIIIIGLSSVSFSQSATSEGLFRTGIRNSQGKHKLSQEQLDNLSESLRHKTGWAELRFDENGLLTLGNRTHINGGSVTARSLLVASVDGKLAIELENYPASPNVIFGCLEAGYVVDNDLTGKRIEVRPLKLDFHDFDQLLGEPELVAAFDLGMVTLHELAHGTLGLHDDETFSKKLGDCVKYMNQIRRELALPERQQYAWDITKVKFTGSVQEIARIRFSRTTENNRHSQTRQYYLRWNTQMTGGKKNAVKPASPAVANPVAR